MTDINIVETLGDKFAKELKETQARIGALHRSGKYLAGPIGKAHPVYYVIVDMTDRISSLRRYILNAFDNYPAEELEGVTEYLRGQIDNINDMLSKLEQR